MATAEQILKKAKSQIGYKESPAGSNKTKYGKAYGMNGQPWCAIYVWWVFKKSNASKLFFDGKKSAYVPIIMDWGIAGGLTVGKGSGKLGDIAGFDFNKNGSSDHIGIIEKKNADGSYTTIEGNTAIGNDANGGKVMRRTRYESQISYIIRPKYDKPKKKAYSGKLPPSIVGMKYRKPTYTKRWQKFLNWAINAKLEPDGIFGEKSYEATTRFQKKVGVRQTGTANKATRAAAKKFKR